MSSEPNRDLGRHYAGLPHLVLVLSVFSQFIPHLPNFSLVFGALLYCGARMRRRDALWFPLAVLELGSIALSRWVYHARWGWGLWTLAGFAAALLAGELLRTAIRPARFVAAALASSGGFFILSNFGVWLHGASYAKSWLGLAACYAAGVPFYRNSLAAALVFGALLFGADALYERSAGRARGSRLEWGRP
ncbi:MAG: DUF6580 family putative transport protein [Terriglobales bacterium]